MDWPCSYRRTGSASLMPRSVGRLPVRRVRGGGWPPFWAARLACCRRRKTMVRLVIMCRGWVVGLRSVPQGREGVSPWCHSSRKARRA
jgi:hypothetical protein